MGEVQYSTYCKVVVRYRTYCTVYSGLTEDVTPHGLVSGSGTDGRIVTASNALDVDVGAGKEFDTCCTVGKVREGK